MTDDRLDKWHTYNTVRFYLADFMPDKEQYRYLMLKVLEQAVRDYIALIDSTVPNERLLWEEARDFIFKEDYAIMWGDMELTTTAFLDILDIDIKWAREQTMKKLNNKEG